MPHYAYIAIQEDDKIATFTVSPDDGSLSHVRDLEVSGGPFTMAVSPDGNHLYVGCREDPQLISYDIDQSNGELSRTGMIALGFNPTFIGTDRKGKFVLVRLLPGRPHRGPSHRRRRIRRRRAGGLDGDRHRRSRHADRSH